MNRGGPTPLGIVIFIVLFILLLIGGFFLFTGGNRETVVEDPISVTDTTAERAVRMTVYGNIVADEERQSYQIEVSPSARIFEERSGYSNRVAESRDLRNSMSAYEEFVYALQKLDYDERRKVPEGKDDDRGTCASGKRYVFEILEFGDVVDSRWTTTCKGSKGTFAGSYRLVEDLFQDQIPEFKLVGRGL